MFSFQPLFSLNAMPHCIVHYSRPLASRIPPAQLIQTVYASALASGLFQGKDIKTRALAFEDYQTGEQQQDFIHVEVRLLSGRTLEQRTALSRHVMDALLALGQQDISLTVQISEMERDSYSKHVS